MATNIDKLKEAVYAYDNAYAQFYKSPTLLAALLKTFASHNITIEDWNTLVASVKDNNITDSYNKDIFDAISDCFDDYQKAIDSIAIKAVVGTYAELQQLDKSGFYDGDVVEVLSDSTQGNNISFYEFSDEQHDFILNDVVSQYVTTNTAQTITADKTLTGNLTKSTYLGDIKFATGSTQKPILEFTSNQPGTAANVVVETVSPYPADSVRHIQQLQNKDGVIALKSDIDAAIEAIEQRSDVTDVVGTSQELRDYDKGTLSDNDIVKVLQDENQNGATTYYRYHTEDETFGLIGSEGPYYTKTQADARFVQMANDANEIYGTDSSGHQTRIPYSQYGNPQYGGTLAQRNAEGVVFGQTKETNTGYSYVNITYLNGLRMSESEALDILEG